MTIDTAGLRVLTRAECLHLLREATVGRVALSHRALPMILPVHYRLDDEDRVVIAATAGTTLHRSTEGAVVAFEAEGPAGATEPLWSVVVRGIATQPAASSRIAPPGHVTIVISTDDVSGREVLDASDPMAPMVTSAIARW